MEIESIIIDAQNNKYVGASGPLLDIIRNLASDNKIADIAVAVTTFTNAIPETKQFIINRVPGIILNSYIIYNLNVTSETLSNYICSNPSWAESIIKNISEPTKLAQAVANILININAHNCT